MQRTRFAGESAPETASFGEFRDKHTGRWRKLRWKMTAGHAGEAPPRLTCCGRRLHDLP